MVHACHVAMTLSICEGRHDVCWAAVQLSAKDMEEMHSLSDIVDFLREYPEDQYQAKLAAVYKYRGFFEWASRGESRSQAVDAALHKVCE